MLDLIPLIFVCGSYSRTKTLPSARACPNCGNPHGAQLYETYNRCHFCFVPVFKTAGGSRQGGREL